jgi:anhydro-N-acetylmuramic acid kinase
MSGTSADGVDAALVRIEGFGPGTRLALERFETVPYSTDVREGVLDMARGYTGVAEVARWHYRLGQLFGEAARTVADGEPLDLVASHGQTVIHLLTKRTYRATLQLGAPAVVVAEAGCTVISDFRAADIAAGGEGAPLVSFVDWMLLRHPTIWRVALNIGGIANLTYLPPESSPELPFAFDTGPGNAPIDRAMYRLSGETMFHDADGVTAASGEVDPDLLSGLMAHPFLQRPPPKSTGLEEFGEEFTDHVLERAAARGLGMEDTVATLTRFTAASIGRALRLVPRVDEVIVAGGGFHNATLMRYLQQELPDVLLVGSDSRGLPGDAKEAIAFAVLANQTLRGLPGNLPSCTGARYETVLGSITPGPNYSELMRKVWR